MALLSQFDKQGVKLGLLTRRVDIDDTEYFSKYFAISEFNPTLTAGKNPISFNGSGLLKDKSEILVECVDSAGNPLFIEQAKSIEAQYTDAAKFVISVHVYNETYNGAGKLILVGTSKKGEIVRWIGNITIDKTLSNSQQVRFYKKPRIEVQPLLYPVVDNTLAAVEYPPPPAAKTATAEAFVNLTPEQPTTGKVTNITLTSGGDGYTFTPAIELKSQNGEGSGATAVCEMIGGKVTDITLLNKGAGYTANPEVIFQIPNERQAPDLNNQIQFKYSFYAYAANPTKDTNKNVIDYKKTDIDYRLEIINSSFQPLVDEDFEPLLFPEKAFNSQMEGKFITLHIDKIHEPFSGAEISTNITSSCFIKKILNSKTIKLSEPLYYTKGKNQLVVNVVNGRIFVDYQFIRYNTNAESNLKFKVNPETSVDIKRSYAEVVYRDIKTFSGFIARHKVYRKSSYSPGDFQLISDELLPSIELLYDPITFNKFYDKMGVFYHEPQIEKYWWPSSDSITLQALSNPIHSVKIASSDSTVPLDGTHYIIVKNDSLATNNVDRKDNKYYPFDADEFNDLQGEKYNSNFISLKKDALYHLSFDIILEKEITSNASCSFYFTSSISGIEKEPGFDNYKKTAATGEQYTFGWKLGEVTSNVNVDKVYYENKQNIYFTPSLDYYGTLVIVPKNCNVILSNISMKVYGDHGFSPDVLVIRIPFDVTTKNEAYDIKAELLDINSNVVYSDLRSVQSFDEFGESLYYSPSATALETANPIRQTVFVEKIINTETTRVTIQSEPYFPSLPYSESTNRLVGFHVPDGQSQQGKLYYTNISKLTIDSDNYIKMQEHQSGIIHDAKSVAVRYDFNAGYGRKIYVNDAGTKEEI